MERIQNIQKEEKNRTLLERGAWDKNFGGGGNSLMEDFHSDKNQALMSEFEQKEEEKSQLIKCGRILWGSLLFAVYMALFIAVLINQMESTGKYHVNHEIDGAIEALRWKDRAYQPEVEMEDTLVNSVSLTSLKEMNDVRIFVKEVLPTLAVQRNQTVDFEETNDPLEFTSTFIQDRKYFVGDMVKLSFEFSKFNPVWELTREALLDKYDFLERREDDGLTDLFVKESMAEQVAADQKDKPLHERWYAEAIGTPEYARELDALSE